MCDCSNIKRKCSGPLLIERDEFGVPMIFGGCREEEIWEALGYLQATDRLWQLFFFVEVGNGRAAAVLGPTLLNSDIQQRIFAYTAEELEQQFNCWTPGARSSYLAFVNGIQRRINEVNANPALIPLELRTLGITRVPLYTRNELLTEALFLLRMFVPSSTAQYQLTNLTLVRQLIARFGEVEGIARARDLIPAENEACPAVITENFNHLCKKCKKCKKCFRCNINDCDKCNKKRSKNNMYTKNFNNNNTNQNTNFKSDQLGNKFYAAELLSKEWAENEEILKKEGLFAKLGSFGVVVGKKKSANGNNLLLGAAQATFDFPQFFYEVHIDSESTGIHAHYFDITGVPWTFFGSFNNYGQMTLVGHLPTNDFLFESINNRVLNRREIIRVRGQPDVPLDVYRSTSGGWVFNQVDANTITTLRSVFIGKQLGALQNLYNHFHINSLKQFINNETNPQSTSDLMSFLALYSDNENIAAFHTGLWTDFNAPDSLQRRVPLGTFGTATVYNESAIRGPIYDINTEEGFYSSWNNIIKCGYPHVARPILGGLDRAYWIRNYILSKKCLTFDDVKETIVRVGRAGFFSFINNNEQNFLADLYVPLFKDLFYSIVQERPTLTRLQAVEFLRSYKGEKISGDLNNLVTGTSIDDRWILANLWLLRIILRIFGQAVLGTSYQIFVSTPTNLFPTGRRDNDFIMVNLLSRLLCTNCDKRVFFNWLGTLDIKAIIVESLDESLALLGGFGSLPWGANKRGIYNYRDAVLGVVHTSLQSNRSSKVYVLEFGKCGVVRQEGITPLGNIELVTGTRTAPIFDIHAFDQAPLFESFQLRRLPLFCEVEKKLCECACK